MKRLLTISCLALALALASGQAANATSITYELTSNHCTIPADCGAPGTVFGLVTLDDHGGANVEFTVSLNSPYVWAKTGAADFLAFKFNATGIVVGDISVSQTWAGQTLVASAGSFNGDGTGPFAFGIACSTCGNGISTINTNLVFSVTGATIAELTDPAANPNIFVADLGNSTNGATGPIDATRTVPDGGSTVMLLGSAVLGLGMLVRRFGKR